MQIGFIGTGRISQAMIHGLNGIAEPPARIWVSARNARIASDLLAQYHNVEIAAENSVILANCDLVVLAVRPQEAEEVLDGLPWKRRHRVLSLMALVPLSRVRELAAPATEIARLLPLPTVARRYGPLALYPSVPWVEPWLAMLGEVWVTSNEVELEALWASTSLTAAFLEHLETVGRWLQLRGVRPALSDGYTRGMFKAVADLAADSAASLAELRDEALTPRGLNEQVLRELREAGVYATCEAALDRIAARLTGGP